MRLIRPFESTKSRLQLCSRRLPFKDQSFPEEVSAGGLALAGGPSPTQHPGIKGVVLSPVLATPDYFKYLESLIICETLWNNYILIFFSHD